MDWYPHATVATIVERDGHFLLVEESEGERLVINQPAGHLDQGETLAAAAILASSSMAQTVWSMGAPWLDLAASKVGRNLPC